ncbi:MAG: MBOAT family protein, partial [Bacteroidetes bacterium]|nr:MBOAT family protein [Bacteroidota bacterium]
MLFNSFEFAIFFPIVTILFFLIPHKLRRILLLLSSCIFYMYFKPEYILILASIIVI